MQIRFIHASKASTLEVFYFKILSLNFCLKQNFLYLCPHKINPMEGKRTQDEINKAGLLMYAYKDLFLDQLEVLKGTNLYRERTKRELKFVEEINKKEFKEYTSQLETHDEFLGHAEMVDLLEELINCVTQTKLEDLPLLSMVLINWNNGTLKEFIINLLREKSEAIERAKENTPKPEGHVE